MSQLSPCIAALAAVDALRARLDVIESSIQRRSSAKAAPLAVGNVSRDVIAPGVGERLDVRVCSDYWDDSNIVVCLTAEQLATAMLTAIATDTVKDLTVMLQDIGYNPITARSQA